MTYRGRVKNGVIVLDPPAQLPEGAIVKIEAEPETASATPEVTENPRSLYDVLRDVIGTADGLPEDASVNIDHYLYGTPKK